MTTSHFRAMSLTMCLMIGGALTSLAHAQSRTEGFAVVKTDGTVLRSGDMPRFYRVMDLKAGSVVRTLGEAEGWTQVVYPNGATAYVEADRAEPIPGAMVRLTRPSSLLAPSALLGASGSWCPLFAEPLPEGTELKVIEEITGIGGKVTKYLVEAPHPPVSPTPSRGFVQSTDLRVATAAEIEGYRRLSAASSGTTQVNPADPATTIPAKPETGTTGQNAKPVLPESGDTDGVDMSLLEPIEAGLLTPVTDPGSGTDIANATPVVDPNANLATNNGGVQTALSASPTRRELIALSINDLNQAFDKLKSLPQSEADTALEELLAECRRTANKFADESGLVKAVNQRIAWLELRMKLRDQRRSLDQTLADADAGQQELSAQVTEWRQGRSFTVIGRIFQSTLYDGNQLPLMYRLESVDGSGFGRTTAYLRGDDDHNFAALIGAVVGIVGSTQYDDALGMRIITAERVETLDQ